MPLQCHALALAAAGVALALAGCAGHEHQRGPVTTLRLADFSDPLMRSHQVPSAEDVRVALLEAGLTPPAPVDPVTAQRRDLDAFFDVETRVGEPVVVDSLIGQVNGRPIYAAEVLGPVNDQLQAEYDRMAWQEFRALMDRLILQRLQEVVLNELFLAEARASLTPQQQSGLGAFLKQIEEDVVGRSGGVQRQAEQDVLAQEGRTLEEYLKLEEERVLIQQLMNDRIRHKTVVSWHDIERAYAARIDEFQPPAHIVLGRIRIRTDDAAAIEAVEHALAAGDVFAEVAKQQGIADDGRWESFTMPAEGIAGLEIADSYKPVLEGLEPGEVSAPMQRGSFTMWLTVLEYEQPEHRSLYDDYDVQRQLQLELFNKAAADAQAEFIDDVLQRGIYDELELMHTRAIVIATTRFPPP